VLSSLGMLEAIPPVRLRYDTSATGIGSHAGIEGREGADARLWPTDQNQATLSCNPD